MLTFVVDPVLGAKHAVDLDLAGLGERLVELHVGLDAERSAEGNEIRAAVRQRLPAARVGVAAAHGEPGVTRFDDRAGVDRTLAALAGSLQAGTV